MQPLNLYWCMTQDHDEDWFIVAREDEEACEWHADAEGYEAENVAAEFVVELPPELQGTDDDLIGWPDEETIKACGGIYLREEQPRVVKFRERVFAEGMLDYQISEMHDDIIECRGGGGPNATTRTRLT